MILTNSLKDRKMSCLGVSREENLSKMYTYYCIILNFKDYIYIYLNHLYWPKIINLKINIFKKVNKYSLSEYQLN